MVELKTIKATTAQDFDAAVNSYLAAGWSIRKLTTGGTQNVAVLVAFLTKDEQ
jgi:hypothetical protein